MPLGQRGSFSIVGFSEAARLFFGKDVSNVTLAEAATMAGVLQSPSALSPFTNAERSRERRNVVLQAMVDAGYVEQTVADAAAKEPLAVVARALEAEAPYFVDYVTRTLDEDYPGLTTTTTPGRRRVHDARPALAARRAGRRSQRPDARSTSCCRATRKGSPKPRSLPSIPGPARFSRWSAGVPTTSRSTTAPSSAAPAGIGVQAVRLPHGVRGGGAQGSANATPASIVDDSPTTWEFDDQVWAPENYEERVRRADHVPPRARAIAQHRDHQGRGGSRIRSRWPRSGRSSASGIRRRPYPSIALGVFEATPFEIATAYTIFPNLGIERPLRHVLRIDSGEKDVTESAGGTADRLRGLLRPFS